MRHPPDALTWYAVGRYASGRAYVRDAKPWEPELSTGMILEHGLEVELYTDKAFAQERVRFYNTEA